MIPGISSRIRRLLLEGPATAAEVAASLSLPVRKASTNLSSLKQTGQVTSVGHAGREGAIYALTVIGRRVHRKRQYGIVRWKQRRATYLRESGKVERR
jgi:predicted ArsR family transcriptional regulator